MFHDFVSYIESVVQFDSCIWCKFFVKKCSPLWDIQLFQHNLMKELFCSPRSIELLWHLCKKSVDAFVLIYFWILVPYLYCSMCMLYQHYTLSYDHYIVTLDIRQIDTFLLYSSFAKKF